MKNKRRLLVLMVTLLALLNVQSGNAGKVKKLLSCPSKAGGESPCGGDDGGSDEEEAPSESLEERKNRCYERVTKCRQQAIEASKKSLYLNYNDTFQNDLSVCKTFDEEGKNACLQNAEKDAMRNYVDNPAIIYSKAKCTYDQETLQYKCPNDQDPYQKALNDTQKNCDEAQVQCDAME